MTYDFVIYDLCPVGTPRFRQMLADPSVTVAAIEKVFAPEAAGFERLRQRFLLYE